MKRKGTEVVVHVDEFLFAADAQQWWWWWWWWWELRRWWLLTMTMGSWVRVNYFSDCWCCWCFYFCFWRCASSCALQDIRCGPGPTSSL